MQNEIFFLIKTMEKTHLDSTLKTGRFCFNRSITFNKPTPKLRKSQQDRWDSYMTEAGVRVKITPILGEYRNKMCYGSSAELNNATIHIISKTAEQTPFCCFRMVTVDDLKAENQRTIFSLSDGIVKKIKSDFGHNSYILIYAPSEFMRRIQKNHSIYARNIHYGEITMEFTMEMNRLGLPQAKIFQKSEDSSWEKEYRIALLTPTQDEQVFIEIGSIEDIAIGGNIDELKTGFLVEGITLQGRLNNYG